MPCNVEILSVGNELLLGNTVNTNASWLAKQITAEGGNVTRITTVPDKLGDISNALIEAIMRKADFLITTGGIGPTFDDMTLKAVAKALHTRMKLDENALAMVKMHYAKRFPNRRITMTRSRLKMAQIPSGGVAIPNPVGTAPAVQLNADRTVIYCLPGVPREAKAIFRESLSRVIHTKAGGMTFAEKWVKVHGVMESSLAPMIDRVMEKWPGIYIKSHPRGAEGVRGPFIELHFSTSSRDPTKAAVALLAAVNDLTTELADFGAQISRTR